MFSVFNEEELEGVERVGYFKGWVGIDIQVQLILFRVNFYIYYFFLCYGWEEIMNYFVICLVIGFLYFIEKKLENKWVVMFI